MPDFRPVFDLSLDELTAASPAAAQPRLAKVQLKDHQLTLLKRCLDFERRNIKVSELPTLQALRAWHADDYIRTRIGILGDKAGAGKSFVVLSLLLADMDAESLDDSAPHNMNREHVCTYGSNRVVISTTDTLTRSFVSMLVIPHNMCAQWVSYVHAFMPDAFRYIMVNNKKSLQAFFDLGSDGWGQTRLIIVTSTLYNRVVEHWSSICKKRLVRVVYDEVDSVNLPSCLPVEAAFTWFVTASYGNLLYPRGHSGWDPRTSRYVWHAVGLKHSGFVRSLFIDLESHVSKEYVKVLVVKNDEAFLAASLNLPPTVNNFIVCRTPAPIRLLQGAVDNAIIDCLNAGDVSGALDRVASQNKSSESNIVALILEKYGRQAANLESRIAYVSSAPLDIFDAQEEREAEVAVLRQRLEDVRARMVSIQERIEATDTCCICFDGIVHKTITSCCSNAFCFKCLNMWLVHRNACPLCKHHPLTSSDLLIVDSKSSNDTANDKIRSEPGEAHDKYTNLELILRLRRAENKDSKFLIFASFENTFAGLARVLDDVGVEHACLKGNHDVINCVMKRYKDKHSELDALLVNTKNYGSGLNLENTTDIIMFHKFDSEIEKQVIGRANRMGRAEPLRVWYLLHANETGRVPP